MSTLAGRRRSSSSEGPQVVLDQRADANLQGSVGVKALGHRRRVARPCGARRRIFTGEARCGDPRKRRVQEPFITSDRRDPPAATQEKQDHDEQDDARGHPVRPDERRADTFACRGAGLPGTVHRRPVRERRRLQGAARPAGRGPPGLAEELHAGGSSRHHAARQVGTRLPRHAGTHGRGHERPVQADESRIGAVEQCGALLGPHERRDADAVDPGVYLRHDVEPEQRRPRVIDGHLPDGGRGRRGLRKALRLRRRLGAPVFRRFPREPRRTLVRALHEVDSARPGRGPAGSG